MKRSFSLFALAIGIVLSVNAQQQSDENSGPLWGLRAALDVNLPGKWHGNAGSVDMYRHGFGGTVGGVCNIYLGRNFYLEPGVSVFYDTYSYNGLVVGDPNGENEEDPSLYKLGVRVPVVAGYAFDISDRFGISIYTGPELSYAFAGDVRIDNKKLIEGSELKLFGKDGYQRRFDCAWKVGVGFPIGLWMVSVDGAFGLTDLMKGDMSFRENRCTVGVTRYF